ncbi:ComEA family DNA-binding protein [Sinomonas susongensis]|uniref:ComEA family DNA-binding protein n=1 Tax=Sinomonas susongensis TaxID=1324851 RepID=UPI001108EE3C|nr:ComEA family DNA-binding protein [Sinomonas susongensis]
MGRGRRAEGARARHRWDRIVPPRGPDETLGSGLLVQARPNDGDDSDEAAADDDPTASGQGPRWVLSARLAAVVVCILGVVAGLWWWSAVSSPPDVRSIGPRDATPSGAGHRPATAETATLAPRESEGAAVIVVHVAGAVGRPGVYQLPQGSRIHDAISAAGGALPNGEPDRLNLAAEIDDGARIAVPRQGEPMEEGAGAGPVAQASLTQGGRTTGSRSASGAAKVNLNTASAQELAQLPRVGPVLAQRIVEYREQHGRFSSPEDLDGVPGIGPKMLESLLPLVSV